MVSAAVLSSAGKDDGPIHIQKDTPLQVRLRKTVSSATAHVNDVVEFEVSEDVKAGDTVVIPRGSTAWGTVVEAAPRARMAKSGKLQIEISAACLADGSKTALHGSGAGSSNISSNESLLALPALPLLLFVYGKDVSLAEGKLFMAYTAESIAVDPARLGKGLNRNCGSAPAEPGGASIPLAGLSTVRAESVPSFGEIYVDGRYFGNAPATLHLPAGDHVLSIRMTGRKMWERVLSMTPGGETSVSAVLEDASLPSKPAGTSESKEK